MRVFAAALLGAAISVNVVAFMQARAIGGPQPAEVQRMLAAQRAGLKQIASGSIQREESWTKRRRD